MIALLLLSDTRQVRLHTDFAPATPKPQNSPKVSFTAFSAFSPCIVSSDFGVLAGTSDRISTGLVSVHVSRSKFQMSEFWGSGLKAATVARTVSPEQTPSAEACNSMRSRAKLGSVVVMLCLQ